MSQTALWTLGLIGVLILAFLCFAFHGPRIEADLSNRAAAAFAEANLDGVSATFEGRDLVLRGTVPDETARQRALAAAAALPGVRRVVDELTVAGASAPSSDAGGIAFTFDRDGGGLMIRGLVPDEATRDNVLSRVRAAFPGLTVRDGLTISADADGAWIPSLDGVLAALAPLPDGSVRIEGGTVVLRGTAPSEEARAQIEAAARSVIPEGYTLRNEITVGDAPDTTASDQIESSGSTDANVQEAEAALREVLAIGQIEFESGTATLTAESREILDRAAEVFARYPVLGAEVQGHSDSQGDDASNLALSQQRAEAVRDYLVDQGADTAALTPQGYGEAEPIADNDTAEGRARNRRVVFSLRAR